MSLAIAFYSTLLLFSCGNSTNTAKEKGTQNQTITTQEKATETTLSTPVVTDQVQVKSTEIEEKTDVKTVIAKTPDTEKIEDIVEPKPVNVEEKNPVEITENIEQQENTILEEAETITTTNTTTNTNVMEDKEAEAESTPVSATAISHNAWNALLKKYVDNLGNVDYASFKNEEAVLQSYLDMLATNKPAASSSKNERLAYYINLYNAATVKLILNNYPTKSIKSIKSPWGKKWVKVGADILSLGNIEHKILRKMNEPRIHFAINCASYSCPKLVNTAFTANQMEKQLEQATKDFVNDTTRNQFTENKAKLSEIFKWYKGDFTDNGSLLEYISKYANKKVDPESKIDYLKYDWSLNEAK